MRLSQGMCPASQPDLRDTDITALLAGRRGRSLSYPSAIPSPRIGWAATSRQGRADDAKGLLLPGPRLGESRGSKAQEQKDKNTDAHRTWMHTEHGCTLKSPAPTSLVSLAKPVAPAERHRLLRALQGFPCLRAFARLCRMASERLCNPQE